ncbi:MAG: TolC family protein [Tannerella sp.]|jgi:outer membrane protein TolC|nr:TolC family protein [Tannerella sp.]
MKRLLFFFVFATGCVSSVHAQFALDECQVLARENYPLIKQYDLIEQSTGYSVANAAKAYLPQVSLAAQATHQSDVATFPQQMTDIYKQFGIDMKGLRKDQYKIALEMNQTIWDGGFTRAQKDISKAEGEISAQSVETELYTLRERINQLYFGILIIEEQLQQNDLLQALLQNNYKTAEAFVRNGVAMQGDLNVIKAEQLSVSQQRIQIESAVTAYRRMLSVMTGGKVDEAATLEKPAIPAVFPNETGNRPELQLFAARAAQFDARKRAVEASVMPRLGFFAQGFYGNPGLNLFKDMTEDAWSWNYMAGVRLQWNFGSFYTKKGNMRKLSLAQRQVDNQRETFLFNNGLQQIGQQNAIEKMRKIMSDDDEIIKLRTSIRRSSEAKYANGTVTVNDLLRDITAENQALLNKSLHELEWLKNIYELKYIMND